jgi:mannose-1-phosphate guanylyltransferase/phosphomannomutase
LWIKLLKNKKKLFGYETKSYWCDIGNLAEYRKAQQDALSGSIKINLPGRKIKDGVWAEEGAGIEDSAIVDGKCVIGGGSEIGKGVKIEGLNVIGKNVIIGAGTRLADCILWDGARVGNNADLKNCILSLNSTLNETNCKLEGAIIIRKG